MNLKIQP